MEHLILVHTGHQLPDYLADCIKQAKRCNFFVHLIVSDYLIGQINPAGIVVVPESSVSTAAYSEYVLKCSNPAFRDNFLHRASSRFFLISSYAKQFGAENFFHIENDVLPYFDFRRINEVLKGSAYQAAFVIDAPNRCVPSVVWFRNHKIIDSLCDFLVANNTADDMVNLCRFFLANRDSVTNFPIIPKDGSYLLRALPTINYANMFDDFRCIFDGAAIGQFLGGIDPRDSNGDSSGFVNETTIFDVSKATYHVETNFPFMLTKKSTAPIANLHIHCKNLKKFMYE
jgi:hypothetical protein